MRPWLASWRLSRRSHQNVRCLLERYAAMDEWRDQPLDLQQAAQGVEIGVGRYFNGRD